MEELLAFVIRSISFLFTAFVGSLAEGWALSVLWGWFVVPLGLPQIGIIQAIGLALVFEMVTTRMPNLGKEEEEKELGEKVLHSLLCAFWSVYKPLFFLLVGFVIHLFAGH